MADYRNMPLVPAISDIIEGNVNGGDSASILWDEFRKADDITEDKVLIAHKIRLITCNEVQNFEGGFCRYSERLRLMIVNTTRDQWNSGASHVMKKIGTYLEKQGLKYRYLPRAAPDGTTILIIALPMTKTQVQNEAQKPSQEVNRQMEEVVERPQQVNREVLQPPKSPEKPKTVRGVIRKPKKEIVLDELEENDE